MRQSGVFTFLGVLVVAFATFWASTDALNMKLWGVNYDFRQGPDWDKQRCKPDVKVDREIRLLQTITNRVRIYSLSDCNVRQVLRTATELEMSVWLGVWVSNRTNIFKQEVQLLKTLIGEKLITDKVVNGINVGSEVLYRNDTTAQALIENLNTVKTVLKENNLNIQVSVTDTLSKLADNPKVIEASDVVTFNVFPFWDKTAIDEAAPSLKGSIDFLMNSTKSKPFIITETGWAAGGTDKRASTASPENAARFMKDFVLMAEKQNWTYYYFAGFDTPYRKQLQGAVDSVEAYFGIFDSVGKMNKHFDGLTIPVTKMRDGPTTALKSAAPVTPAPSSVRQTSSAGLAPTSLLVAILVSIAWSLW